MREDGAPVTRRCRLAALVLALAALAPQALRAQGIECDGTAGEREVRALEFRGNKAFPSRDLELRVSTTASDFLQRRLHAFGTRRCLDSDALRLDVGRLRVFYQRHGYYATTVDTAVTSAGDGDAVQVAFLIDEGQPVLIDSLRVSGLDSAVRTIVDTSEVALRKGIPFDRTKLQATIDSIKSRLRNNGYPRADVAASYTVDTVARHASVGLTVLPGTRAHIGQIRVFSEPLPGQEASRLGTPTVLRLSTVRAGDLYRDRDLTDAQRTLYQTDLFRSVEVRLAPDSVQPRGDSLVTLDIVVRENYLRQVDTEIGWSVLDCFKDRTRFVDKSFLGEARRVELTAQVSKVGFGTPTRFGNGNFCAPAIREDTFSAKLNYFTSASLRLPTLFGFRASPTFSVYSERRSEYRAFLRTTLVGGEAAFSRDVARDLPLRLAYSLEYGRTEAPPALLCALFSFCTDSARQFVDQNRRLAVASAHVDRIRTDNPFAPRAGTVLRLDLRTSLRELYSDPQLEFLKGLSDASVYKALGPGATLAVRLRLGTVLGRTLSFTDATGFIPPEERLYAGGAASVRGFQQNALGDLIYIAESAPSVVAGTGDTVYVRLAPTSDSQGVRRVVPVGGNSLIVANLELRLRSRFFPELLQYTVFVDGGDVWSRETLIGRRSHDASKLFLNGLKWTPGIGVRVFTPVGPFQANVGYNPFAQPAGAIYFDASAAPPDGLAPLSLYCVTPGNTIPAVPNGSGRFEQVAGVACPAFTPPRKNTFLSRLTFTFSIGPDF
jgi:outer membrane protein assembly factor BamA